MFCGNHIDLTMNEFLSSLPPSICSFHDLVHILESLDSCRICIGNSEDKFLNVVRHRNSTPKCERLCFCHTYCPIRYRRSGNFHVAFFRVRNVHTIFRRDCVFRIRNVHAFNFRCLSNRRKIFNGENLPIYGISIRQDTAV